MSVSAPVPVPVPVATEAPSTSKDTASTQSSVASSDDKNSSTTAAAVSSTGRAAPVSATVSMPALKGKEVDEELADVSFGDFGSKAAAKAEELKPVEQSAATKATVQTAPRPNWADALKKPTPAAPAPAVQPSTARQPEGNQGLSAGAIKSHDEKKTDTTGAPSASGRVARPGADGKDARAGQKPFAKDEKSGDRFAAKSTTERPVDRTTEKSAEPPTVSTDRPQLEKGRERQIVTTDTSVEVTVSISTTPTSNQSAPATPKSVRSSSGGGGGVGNKTPRGTQPQRKGAGGGGGGGGGGGHGHSPRPVLISNQEAQAKGWIKKKSYFFEKPELLSYYIRAAAMPEDLLAIYGPLCRERLPANPLPEVDEKFKFSKRPIASTVEKGTPEYVYKMALVTFNKLSEDNFDKILGQFLELGIDQEESLFPRIVELIVTKAQMEATFVDMYVRFCLSVQDRITSVKPEFGESFKRCLVARCTDEFSSDRQLAYTAIDERADLDSEEKEEKKYVLKLRYLGHMQLIAGLFQHDMMTHDMMHSCVSELIDSTDEEKLVCLCRLLTIGGRKLEDQDKRERLTRVKGYIDSITAKSEDSNLSSRTKYSCKELVELHKNRWRGRNEPLPSTSRPSSSIGSASKGAQDARVLSSTKPSSSSSLQTQAPAKTTPANIERTASPALPPSSTAPEPSPPATQQDDDDDGGWNVVGSSTNAKKKTSQSSAPAPGSAASKPGQKQSLDRQQGKKEKDDRKRKPATSAGQGAGNGPAPLSSALRKKGGTGFNADGGFGGQGKQASLSSAAASSNGGIKKGSSSSSASTALKTPLTANMTSAAHSAAATGKLAVDTEVQDEDESGNDDTEDNDDGSGSESSDEGGDGDEEDEQMKADPSNESKKKAVRRAKGLVDEYLRNQIIDELFDGMQEVLQGGDVEVSDIVKSVLVSISDKKQSDIETFTDVFPCLIDRGLMSPEQLEQGIIDFLDVFDDLSIDVPYLARAVAALFSSYIQKRVMQLALFIRVPEENNFSFSYKFVDLVAQILADIQSQSEGDDEETSNPAEAALLSADGLLELLREKARSAEDLKKIADKFSLVFLV